MIDFISAHKFSIQLASFCGMIGFLISIMVYDEHPNVKTFFMRFITSLILAPIAFMLSGVWVTDDIIRISIAVCAGFIGRPILRGVHRVSMLISETPLETIDKIVSIWRKK